MTGKAGVKLVSWTMTTAIFPEGFPESRALIRTTQFKVWLIRYFQVTGALEREKKRERERERHRERERERER